ncbi:condensation domain-containing protein, partial [Nonomuraea sp. MCN248]
MSEGIRDRLAALSPDQRAALEARLLGRRASKAPGPAIPHTDPALGAPLTEAQRRFWVVDQLDPGNPAYTLSWAYRIEGELDAAALAAAFDALVDRHPVLGYVVTLRDGEPWQTPGPVRPALTVEDLTPAEADRAALAEARFRFDLAAGPLTRARLLRVGEREHRLVLTLHHLLADRWSVAILLRDLLALHAGDPLPAAPASYAAYATWQRARPAAREADLAHWRETLAELPDVLDLPADRPRPPVRDNAGRRLLFDLDRETADGVRALAAGRRATPFMVLAAALQALLARYTGQSDIPIGTPVSARPDPSLDHTVGLFLNTVVLRGDLSGDPAFADLVERTRERALDAFEHAALPFETLVEDLSAGRDLSRNPLFQVMLAYQNTPALPGGARGLRLERLDVRPGTAMFDLDLIVEERPDGRLLCVLDYPTDLFDDDRMTRLAGHLRTLLAAAVADPGLRLSELPLMAAGERERTLAAGQGPALPYPGRGVHELVAEQAARTPDATAVADVHGGGLTYAELEAKAARLAARLRRLGVGPETRVGVCLPRTPDLIAALLGVLKAGGCYVPLDPGYPPDRIAQILDDSGAALAVTTGALQARLPGHPGRLLLEDLPADGEHFGTGAHPDQAAYLIYTSGSTGRAKGVVVPHRGLASLLEHVRERPGPAPGERYLFLTSVSFDIAMIEIFGPLVTGGTVVVAATGEIEQVHRLVKDGDLHTVQATPSMLESLLPALAARVPRVVSTGEALPAGLAARLREVTDELWDLYGPTETTVWSTGHLVTGDMRGSIGRPVANTSAYVV